MSVESVVVALDGESKCGKTTIIETIAEEARFQAGIVPNILDPANPDWAHLNQKTKDDLAAYHEQLKFSSIASVSGGNPFRAATFYVALLECAGQVKSEFDHRDYDALRNMLDEDGIIDILQNDPNVGSRVSEVAQFPGVQTLCGRILCDEIVELYHEDGGGNLVIVDARDPVGHMQRNGVLGIGPRQINPGHILPIYIDTPAEVAAERLSGDYAANLELVNRRRKLDAEREELPVVMPSLLLDHTQEWLEQFQQQRTEVALPYRLDNGRGVMLENIQWLGGYVAAAAHDVAMSRDLDYSNNL